MLTLKDREERGRSIRAHILAYVKTGRAAELEKAHAELKVLMKMEGLVSPVDIALEDAEAARREVSGNWSRGAEENELDVLRRLARLMRQP